MRYISCCDYRQLAATPDKFDKGSHSRPENAELPSVQVLYRPAEAGILSLRRQESHLRRDVLASSDKVIR